MILGSPKKQPYQVFHKQELSPIFTNHLKQNNVGLREMSQANRRQAREHASRTAAHSTSTNSGPWQTPFFIRVLHFQLNMTNHPPTVTILFTRPFFLHRLTQTCIPTHNNQYTKWNLPTEPIGLGRNRESSKPTQQAHKATNGKPESFPKLAGSINCM